MISSGGRLIPAVVKLGKQKVVQGTIVDVLGNLCSVRMSGRGVLLRSLKYIGTTPAKGDTVFVDYRSGTPVVHTNSDNLETQIEEVSRTLTATFGVAPTPAPAPESPAQVDAVRRFPGQTTAPTVNDDVDLGYEVTDVWLDETGDAVYICMDATNGAAVWIRIASVSSSKRFISFAIEGTLSVVTGQLRMYNNFGSTFTITKVFISVSTAPTGSSILVDVNKNGTTLFTTQSNRPAISASAFTGVTTTIENNSFADGDYLTMDIDQKGSTIAGIGLVVQIYFQ